MSLSDYELQRCTRRCAASGRELAPGEAFYTVLLRDGSQLRRIDYAAEAWNGPPEDAPLGWWRSQVPTPQMKRARLAPNDVLLDLFEELQNRADQADEPDQPNQPDMLYVVSLLLLRRRVVRQEDIEQHGDAEVLVLYCPRNEKTYRVATLPPDSSRIEPIQQELATLLFAEGQ